MNERPLSVLCLASYHKGEEFLRQLKREGARVLLLTSKSLEHELWPRESIDEIYFMPDVNKEWVTEDMIQGVSHVARTERFDRIVALDDFDVEKAAMLREHLRVGGMGDTTARYFRDKLAMRTRAVEAGLAVPPFVALVHDETVNGYLGRVPGPWVVKPRFQAGGIGIKKVSTPAELWTLSDLLAGKRSFHLVEKFVPGSVYHVDSIVDGGEIVYSIASAYAKPPMEVVHEGRVFSTRTLSRDSATSKRLLDLNEKLLRSMGLRQGVSHSEFIESDASGELLFLETSSRVGGAHIVELIEGATGLNLWAEWARLEVSSEEKPYVLPPHRDDAAGLIVSLARQEKPDMSVFDAPEVVWRLHKKHHVGLVVVSPSDERVTELLESYTKRVYDDFFASQPLPDRPTS